MKSEIEHASITGASVAVLGVTIGEERYLVPMEEVGEVIAIPKLAQVPLTQPWFAGLANVRGNLYGITDLSIYLGNKPVPYNMKSRILLVSTDDKIQGGFIVNNMLGIRSLSEFIAVAPPKKELMRGIVACYEDTEGRAWRKLSLLELARDEKFMQVASD